MPDGIEADRDISGQIENAGAKWNIEKGELREMRRNGRYLANVQSHQAITLYIYVDITRGNSSIKSSLYHWAVVQTYC